jgi:hypothetical protein
MTGSHLGLVPIVLHDVRFVYFLVMYRENTNHIYQSYHDFVHNMAPNCCLLTVTRISFELYYAFYKSVKSLLNFKFQLLRNVWSGLKLTIITFLTFGAATKT